MQISIKRNTKKYNEFKLTATLTEGKLLVLKHALENYATSSELTQEVLQAFTQALQTAGIN